MGETQFTCTENYSKAVSPRPASEKRGDKQDPKTSLLCYCLPLSLCLGIEREAQLDLI